METEIQMLNRTRTVTALDALSTSPTTTAAASLIVLVVDDDECIRELLGEILESEGCEVALAGSGNEALELFAADQFDAVFTDVEMPEMSGWELARVIREQDSLVPLAVITGWGEAVSVTEHESAQVDWIVSKPFTMERIVEIAADISKGDKHSAAHATLSEVA